MIGGRRRHLVRVGRTKSNFGPLSSRSLMFGTSCVFSLAAFLLPFLGCRRFGFVVFIYLLYIGGESTTGNPPAPWPRAPAPPSEPPVAGAPVPRLLCRALRSLQESPPQHTLCIRPEHRSRGETRDGAAVPAAQARLARRSAAPGSAAPHLAADSSASARSLHPLPENASP